MEVKNISALLASRRNIELQSSNVYPIAKWITHSPENKHLEIEVYLMLFEVNMCLSTGSHLVLPSWDGPDGMPIGFLQDSRWTPRPDISLPLRSALTTHTCRYTNHPKDPMLCPSYRPIALLNNDLKILSKLLTLKLNRLLSSIIELDQTGFVALKSTDLDLRRLHTNIYAQHSNRVHILRVSGLAGWRRGWPCNQMTAYSCSTM